MASVEFGECFGASASTCLTRMNAFESSINCMYGARCGREGTCSSSVDKNPRLDTMAERKAVHQANTAK